MMYDQLITLPLFVGLGVSEMTEIVTQAHFDFRKYKEGEKIVSHGDACDRLIFVFRGLLGVDGWADDYGYEVSEILHVPAMLEPEALFGLRQRFTHDYRAAEDCSTVAISKDEVRLLSERYDIVRLNLLNAVATKAQRRAALLWRATPPDLEHRIIRWFMDRCLHPAGRKVFHIKMTRLAAELNDSRLDISKALNHLQDQGYLHLTRGIITINEIENQTGVGG